WGQRRRNQSPRLTPPLRGRAASIRAKAAWPLLVRLARRRPEDHDCVGVAPNRRPGGSHRPGCARRIAQWESTVSLLLGVRMMLENREGGCHCGRVRFRARVDLDLLSQCNCSVCTKKGILHLGVSPEDFELLRGKTSLTSYTFGTSVAQH